MPKRNSKKSSSQTNQDTPKSPVVPDINIDSPLNIESETESQEIVPLEEKNKFLYYLGILSLILIVLLLAVILFIFKKESQKEVIVEITPTPQLSAPSPVPFKPSDWSVEILNGSGIAGSAAVAAEKLSAIGFIVTKTGNADRSNYQNIQVYLSADSQRFKEDFMESFNSVYPQASFAGSLDSSSPSARIIIGR